MRLTRLLLPLLVAGLLLAGCGGDDEPEAGAANGTDRAFAADMVAHHESAVEMAEVALERGESPFVEQLAGDIIRTQKAEIETLRAADRRLAAEGVERGDLGMGDAMAGMDMDPGMLETADPFDEAFLEMMIPHHEDAIRMARVELERGGDPELQDLARDIIDAQQREIEEMRKELGGEGGGSHDGH